MTKRIVLTGGGSGGHVYPLLAVAEELRLMAISDSKMELQLFYIGPKDQFAEILRDNGIGIKNIASAKLRRYFSLLNFLDIPKFFIGLIQALFALYVLMPDAVFSKGGTGALPVVFSAWFYRIPIMIHESDAVPGLTNLLSARFAKRIAVSFERAMNYFDPGKTAWVGTPVRRTLLEGTISKGLAKQELGFQENQPLLLVLGGSQGSQRINEFIVSNLPELLKEVQILHQAGWENHLETQKLSRTALINTPLRTEIERRYQISPYLENLKSAFSAADLVFGRAGSGAIFELAAFGKPAILVPLTADAGQQRANAEEFKKAGGGVVIEESNLLAGVFLSQLRLILKDPETLEKMSAASAKFYKPDAAGTTAREILNIIP